MNILKAILLTALVVFPISSLRAGQFDSAWIGHMKCGTCSACNDNGLEKRLDIEIQGKNITISNNGSDRLSGEINLEDGLFSSIGDISITGTYAQSGNSTRLSGKYNSSSITLKGTRGPRSCTVAMTRTKSKAEIYAEEQQRIKNEQARQLEIAKQKAKEEEEKLKKAEAARQLAEKQKLKNEAESKRLAALEKKRQADLQKEKIALEKKLKAELEEKYKKESKELAAKQALEEEKRKQKEAQVSLGPVDKVFYPHPN